MDTPRGQLRRLQHPFGTRSWCHSLLLTVKRFRRGLILFVLSIMDTRSTSICLHLPSQSSHASCTCTSFFCPSFLTLSPRSPDLFWRLSAGSNLPQQRLSRLQDAKELLDLHRNCPTTLFGIRNPMPPIVGGEEAYSPFRAPARIPSMAFRVAFALAPLYASRLKHTQDDPDVGRSE